MLPCSAEKYLKGLLASFGETIPFIHDLVALNTLCQKHTDTLNLSEKMLSLLTDYAVEARYELDFFPDKELATKAYVLAEQVREVVKAETKA